jgi:hypothetical protein
MKKFLAAGFLFLITLQSVWAAEPTPTDASVMELLTVTKAQSLMASGIQQIDAAMRARMDQALAGRPLSPEQKKILDDMRVQSMSLIVSELKWEKLAPQYLEVYKKSFTQKEVDGMLAFYKTEAGQAVINKMPAVMQYSMQLMQNMLASLMPKMEKIQKDGLAKLQAAGK